MRQSILCRCLLVSLLGTLLVACGAGPAGSPPATVAEVTVVTLKAQALPLSSELPGRTRAFLTAEVRPQVSGIIKQRLFTEGGVVKAGQVLYQLDDALYRAQQARDVAALHRAEAQLNSARGTAKRLHELMAINAISRQDLEDADAAEAQADADVGAARAAVESSAVTLAYARIVAPISGRIGRSNMTQGALVTANQSEPLALIQQVDPIYVEVNQSSSSWLAQRQLSAGGQLHAEDAGSAVKVLLQNGAPHAQMGTLQFADVSVDPATGSYLLRAVVPNPDQLLLPGMYVRAVISEGTLENAILAPQQGISRDDKGKANAMIVDQEGKVASRSVEVLRTIGDQWLIGSGLAAGDRVIVEGVQSVTAGAAVHAVEKAAPITPVAAR